MTVQRRSAFLLISLSDLASTRVARRRGRRYCMYDRRENPDRALGRVPGGTTKLRVALRSVNQELFARSEPNHGLLGLLSITPVPGGAWEKGWVAWRSGGRRQRGPSRPRGVSGPAAWQARTAATPFLPSRARTARPAPPAGRRCGRGSRARCRAQRPGPPSLVPRAATPGCSDWRARLTPSTAP